MNRPYSQSSRWMAFVSAFSIFASAVTFAPKQADAGVGYLFRALNRPNSQAIILTGGAFIAAGIALIGASLPIQDHDRRTGLALWGAVIIVYGAFILDEKDPDGSVIPTYERIGVDEATKLGLTDAEFRSYHRERARLNAVVQTIGSDISKIPNPTLEDSKNLWEQHRGAISSDTFSAMVKINKALWITHANGAQ